MEAGATRLHGAAIGIGERVGNTPMDLLLVNLVLMGHRGDDLSRLAEYCETVSAATGVPIPPNYPVVGRDAFRTATGVHAAAVIKAFRKHDPVLADAVYSGVPASLVGREQEIEVGPMSGKSNVVYWLEKRGITATDELVDRIFAKAKGATTVLRSACSNATCCAKVARYRWKPGPAVCWCSPKTGAWRANSAKTRFKTWHVTTTSSPPRKSARLSKPTPSRTS